MTSNMGVMGFDATYWMKFSLEDLLTNKVKSFNITIDPRYIIHEKNREFLKTLARDCGYWIEGYAINISPIQAGWLTTEYRIFCTPNTDNSEFELRSFIYNKEEIKFIRYLDSITGIRETRIKCINIEYDYIDFKCKSFIDVKRLTILLYRQRFALVEKDHKKKRYVTRVFFSNF